MMSLMYGIACTEHSCVSQSPSVQVPIPLFELPFCLFCFGFHCQKNDSLMQMYLLQSGVHVVSLLASIGAEA
jgi:hypothetical protein